MPKEWLSAVAPQAYRPHALHDAVSAYGLNNCYVDLLVELVHALGEDPLAMLGSLAAPSGRPRSVHLRQAPPGGPRALYGIDVHERVRQYGLTVRPA